MSQAQGGVETCEEPNRQEIQRDTSLLRARCRTFASLNPSVSHARGRRPHVPYGIQTTFTREARRSSSMARRSFFADQVATTSGCSASAAARASPRVRKVVTAATGPGMGRPNSAEAGSTPMASTGAANQPRPGSGAAGRTSVAPSRSARSRRSRRSPSRSGVETAPRSVEGSSGSPVLIVSRRRLSLRTMSVAV